MSWYLEGAILLGAFLLVLFSGLPVAFTFFVVGTPALFFAVGGATALSVLTEITWKVGTSYYLISLPLFILMAELLMVSNVIQNLFLALRNWLGRLPGGLGVTTIFGCAGFGAICGTSTATAVTIGKMAIPEMRKLGYDKSLLAGTVAAGGTLGILIPPSIPLIIYAMLSDQSIGRLFAAGWIPGIILSVMFSLYMTLRVWWNPALAPPTAGVSWQERFSSLLRALPFGLVVAAIFVPMFFGWTGVNEAAGCGVVAAIVLGIAVQRLTWKDFGVALLRASQLTCAIGLIVVGASIFTYVVTYLRVPQSLAAAVLNIGMSPIAAVVAMMVIVFILGMFIDAVSILVLTMPIFLPLAIQLNIDLVWLAILMVIGLEQGLITPPVGLNLYVLQGIGKEHGIGDMDVISGIIPYLLVMILGQGLLIVFPGLTTFLPRLLFGG